MNFKQQGYQSKLEPRTELWTGFFFSFSFDQLNIKALRALLV